MTTVFISDVHGRLDHLQQIYNYLNPYQIDNVVYLGDLHDCRNDDYTVDRSAQVIETVYSQCQRDDAFQMVQSNHTHRLTEIISGVELTPFRGMYATLDAMIDYDNREEIAAWLTHLPDVITICDNDTQYIVSHADPTATTRYGRIYGNRRNRWWENPPTNAIYVCGHWHQYHLHPNAIVLDPYGDTNDGVAALMTLGNGRYQLISSCDTYGLRSYEVSPSHPMGYYFPISTFYAN